MFMTARSYFITGFVGGAVLFIPAAWQFDFKKTSTFITTAFVFSLILGCLMAIWKPKNLVRVLEFLGHIFD